MAGCRCGILRRCFGSFFNFSYTGIPVGHSFLSSFIHHLRTCLIFGVLYRQIALDRIGERKPGILIKESENQDYCTVLAVIWLEGTGDGAGKEGALEWQWQLREEFGSFRRPGLGRETGSIPSLDSLFLTMWDSGILIRIPPTRLVRLNV